MERNDNSIYNEGESKMSDYRFYGWNSAEIQDRNGLHPADYYDILSAIWCAETCAPRLRKNWSTGNKTMGQCSVTAFLMQDFFGGKVYGTFLDGTDIYKKELNTGEKTKSLIVIGNESNGISLEVASTLTERLLIPPYPENDRGSESLNAAVATAITVAEFRRRLNNNQEA